MKHITPTPGKMCFSFAPLKKPLPIAEAKPRNLYVNLKCTQSRKLGALYQFMVRKPGWLLQSREICSRIQKTVWTIANGIQAVKEFGKRIRLKPGFAA